MSRKIRVLSDEDFSIINTSAGKLLACNTTGYFLVLFYSNKSDVCKDVFKAISQLVVSECSIGVMSVFRDSKVVHISKGTRTELKRVPSVMMYVDGHPKAIYHSAPNVKPTVDDYQRFVVLIMEKFRSGGMSYRQPPKNGDTHDETIFDKNGRRIPDYSDKNGRRIPDYSDGIPICSEGICYMTITDAYPDGGSENKNKMKNKNH
jgi:hypothetical protein